MKGLAPETELTAIALLSLPDDIRGYGPVKQQAYDKSRSVRRLKDLSNPPPLVQRQIAAE